MKPREFWINKCSAHTIGDCPLTYSAVTKDIFPEYASIHVIEYSAYEALKASMRSWEVAKEIEIYANSDKQWNKLTEQNRLMREALEDIASDDDEGCSFLHQRQQDQRWAELALAKCGDPEPTAKE